MKKIFFGASVIFLGLTLLNYFSFSDQFVDENVKLELVSPNFKNGGPIPSEFTCDGENISPALQWSGYKGLSAAPDLGPKGSYSIIVDDPDAKSVTGKTWVHWVVLNLKTKYNFFVEGLDLTRVLSRGDEVINSFGVSNYMGPCPPKGQEHKYRFTLFAMDIGLDADVSIQPRILELIKSSRTPDREAYNVFLDFVKEHNLSEEAAKNILNELIVQEPLNADNLTLNSDFFRIFFKDHIMAQTTLIGTYKRK